MFPYRMHSWIMVGKEKMGLFSCVALIVGACIGSAIFSISGVTVLYAGPSSILSWIIAAFIYLGYGMVVTELAVRYPYSGGIYLFPKCVFGGEKGSALGFASAWGYIISNIIAIGFSAIYFGVYLQYAFPWCGSGPWAAIISCVIAAFVVIIGGRRSSRVQNILVVLLLACLSIYCIVALSSGAFDESVFSAEKFFTSGTKGASGFISAVPLALVAYGGCIVVAFLASDVKKPGRDIPVSLLVGLILVCAVYVMLIVCIVGTLPVEILRNDTDSCYIPLLASASQGALQDYAFLKGMLSLCGAVAFLTTMIALLSVNVRAVQAVTGACDNGSLKPGETPSKPELVSSRCRRILPVLVITLICILLCFLKDRTIELISLGAILNIVSMSITCLSLVVTGKKEKAVSAQVRHRGVFVTRVLPFAVIGIFILCYVSDIIAGGGKIWIFTAVIYAAALMAYIPYRRKETWFAGCPTVSGTVVHGKGHGHLHGMPTANILPDSCCGVSVCGQDRFAAIPKAGVWKTRAIIGGRSLASVTNVGIRPSDDDDPTPTIESHIIDFDEDIYGKEITLVFEEYIRPTVKFENMDVLRKQVEKDIAYCLRSKSH